MRVVYYAILLFIILEELLEEIDYIIVKFPEYNMIPLIAYYIAWLSNLTAYIYIVDLGVIIQ